MLKFDIPAKAMDSPALIRKATSAQSKYPYPARYKGKTPLVVRMTQNVKSDLPPEPLRFKDLSTLKDNEHFCWVNSYGAVAIILPSGETLGVKPDEFEVLVFHEDVMQPELITVDIKNSKLLGTTRMVIEVDIPHGKFEAIAECVSEMKKILEI